MKKISLLLVLVFVCTFSSCTVNDTSNIGNKTDVLDVENPEINLDYLIKNSQLCYVVSGNKKYDEEKICKDVIKDGKMYMTRIITACSNSDNKDTAITIVQSADSYVDLNGINILFLNEEPNEEGVYTIVGGSSSVIHVYKPGKIQSDNQYLQKDIKERFDGEFQDFNDWFMDYYGHNKPINDSNELSTTLPNFEDYSDVITTAKPE